MKIIASNIAPSLNVYSSPVLASAREEHLLGRPFYLRDVWNLQTLWSEAHVMLYDVWNLQTSSHTYGILCSLDPNKFPLPNFGK
jgi:hypothetical protein